MQQDLLCEYAQSIFGISFLFPWQRLIVSSVLESMAPLVINQDKTEDITNPEDAPQEPLRQIAVLPTGAGKSLCWMLPAALIKGITVAVFPLLSLMEDQKRRLEECGLESITLRGGLERKEKEEQWSRLEKGRARIVLTNPEMLAADSIRKRLKNLKPAFLVIDETHTVTQWGESFRPACAALGEVVQEWSPPAVLALTATAGPHIRSRIQKLLFNGDSPQVALANPDRPEIRYGVIPALSRNHYLTELTRREPRPLIVFGPTRSSVEQAARLLRIRLNDNRVCYYHAGLSREEKSRLEDWFYHSQDGILCATCAYGMGVDKKNIRTVIHLAPPGSPEAYLQEAGRASRDGAGARAWLIWTGMDLEEIHTAGKAKEPRKNEKAEENVEAMLRSRRQLMRNYISSREDCRRKMLLEALGTEAEDCPGCDICGGGAWTKPPEEAVMLKAIRQNRGSYGKGMMVRILAGRKTAEVRRKGLILAKNFGIFKGWELEDLEEAMELLIRLGKLKKRRSRLTGIWK